MNQHVDLTHSDEGDERRLRLSCLMDGEAMSQDDACRSYAALEQSRADWHAYHVIGDVLRSQELAPRSATADAQFVGRLRARLANEPVVLAPTSSVPRSRGPSWRRPWMAPVAVAAGVMAVAGALVVTRSTQGDAAGGGGVSLQARGGDSSGAVPGVPVSVAPVGEGVVLRNADLDRYLAAHRRYAPESVSLPQDGVMRSAVAVPPTR